MSQSINPINSMVKKTKLRKSKKLFLQNNITQFCFNIPLIKNLFLEDMGPVYCGKCIQCLLTNQLRHEKDRVLLMAPKKQKRNSSHLHKVYIRPRNLMEDFQSVDTSSD